jgi:acetyltransferase-like isoleucine patch superfamily enzyme
MEVTGKADNNLVVGFSQDLKLNFMSHDCRVILEDDCILAGLEVSFFSPNCILKIGRRSILRGGIFFKTPNHSVEIGQNVRARTGLFMNVTGGNIRIGNDCLLAAVKFRTSDSHVIRDVATGEILNPPGNIDVEDRVWLAEDVLLLRNAHVGSGSAVGARSIVNREIPPNSLAVGAPARVVREGISWEE